MGYPRSHLVDNTGGVYHVCSRCVRRAFLCGRDHQTGYNFDYRREWIESRLFSLTKIFAIDLYGYAVMSNHYHAILSVNPSAVASWSEKEVAEKWLNLNPHKLENAAARQERLSALLSNEARVQVIRDRLGSLSWFMRYLNEPLARLANKEDDCKGRFWEGRFKSQRLLDEQAILACMIYVDLNPVRAGLVKDPLAAKHTSLARRCKISNNQLISVIDNSEIVLPIEQTLPRYIELARRISRIQQNTQSSKLEIQGVQPPEIWLKQYLPIPGRWPRAIGSLQAIRDYADDLGLCWIRTG